MKLSKAIRLLKAAYPGRTISVEKAVRWYGRNAPTDADEVCYSAAVLPGWDGTDCSIAYGSTLREAVQTALDNSPAAQLDTVSLASPLDRPHVRTREEEAAYIIGRGQTERGRYDATGRGVDLTDPGPQS